MRKTGVNLQTIALLMLMIGLTGLFFTAISLSSSSPSRFVSTIWVSAAIIGANYLIFCLLLYGVGKIVEGIGNIQYDVRNMANISNQGKEEKEEKLPNL